MFGGGGSGSGGRGGGFRFDGCENSVVGLLFERRWRDGFVGGAGCEAAGGSGSGVAVWGEGGEGAAERLLG